MKKNKYKVKILLLIIIMLWLIFSINCEAKYNIEEKQEIISISNADNTFPTINGRNYSVDDENFNTDVTINYEDNLKIKYAKYWFNANEKSFDGDGIEFDSGATFTENGFYKIEVSDMYDNIIYYTFIIDKEFNDISVRVSDMTEAGGNLIIEASDNVIGIQKLEIYINDTLYQTYTYEEYFINSKLEELYVDIDNLPFYKEVYVIGTDFYGNQKSSDKIIPNQNWIYDLQDLISFRDVVNNNITNFANQSIYLLNDIDLITVCSSSVGSWTPIGKSTYFMGIFEGNNHTISNLYINTSSANYGLFARVYGTVQNLTLSGEIANCGDFTGAFAGRVLNGGKIVNCINNVTITNSSNSDIGGIAGYINGGSSISYCRNKAKISGGQFVGGILGYNNNGTISYCNNSGVITSNNDFVGGITGFTDNSTSATNTISYSYNAGNITGSSCVGGISGAAWNGTGISVTLAYVYNIGTINNTNSSKDFNGGILGGTYYSCYGTKISNSNILKYGYNIGTIKSSSNAINQITPNDVTCTGMYYISGKSNDSGVGTALASNLFKASLSNTSSLLYKLNSATAGVWTINSNYNSGNVIFLWQVSN